MFDFFYLVSELKKVPRKGWKTKVGIERPESVADHLYCTAVMAMVLSDSKGLNTEKVIKMALLHDLAESVTGDFTPDEISKNDKATIENETMREILSKLPDDLAKKYNTIWKEYSEGITKESVLLHDVDKLEMAIQAAKYSSEGFPNEKLKIFVESARKEIRSDELLKIIDTISYK